MQPTFLKRLWIAAQTWVDGLWGYDVFIAHRRSDGAAYAKALFDALEQEQLAGFIDQVVYGAGDSLLISTRRHSSKSTVLVVIGSPDVLSPRTPVDWVYEEIEAYLATHPDPKIIVICFGDPLLKAFESHTATLPETIACLRTFLRIEQPLNALTEPPHADILDGVARQLMGRRRYLKRLRIFQGIAMALLLLLALVSMAFFLESQQRFLAENRLVLANSQVTAADARLLGASELNAALRQSARAYQQAPSDDARAALLDSFDRAAQIVGFFPCEQGWKAGGLTFATGPEYSFAFSCLKDRRSTLYVMPSSGSMTKLASIDGEVRNLTFATDDSLAVDGASRLRVFDLTKRTMLEFGSAGDMPIGLLTAAPGGILVSLQQANQLRVWRFQPQGATWSAGDPITVTGSIADVSYSPAEQRAIITTYDGNTFGLPLPAGPVVPIESTVVQDTTNPNYDCESKFPRVTRVNRRVMSESADESLRAYLTDDNRLVVTHPGTGDCLVLQGNTHNAQVLVRPDGRRVATLGAYLSSDTVHGLILWNLEQLHPLATVVVAEPDPHHLLDFSALSVSESGSSWLGVDRLGSALWNGKAVDLKTVAAGNYVTSVALSPKGGDFAAGFSSGRIARFHSSTAPTDVSTGKDAMNALWYDGEDIYGLSASSKAWRWKAGAQAAESVVTGAGDTDCLSIRGMGGTLAAEVVRSDGPRLQLINMSSGEVKEMAVPAVAGRCRALVYNDRVGVGVWVPQEYTDMTLFRPQSQTRFTTFPNPLTDVSGLRKVLKDPQLSADGKFMAAIANEDRVALFNVASGRLLGTLRAPHTEAIALSEDGQILFSYNRGIGLVRWDLDATHWQQRADSIAGRDPRTN